MEIIDAILQKGINIGATDIHLAPGQVPVYRVNKQLMFDKSKLPLSRKSMLILLDYFSQITTGLKESFEKYKQADFSYAYSEHRFRINVSNTKGTPTYSIRIIKNNEIDVQGLGIQTLIKRMKKITSGMILVTGKVNSGKSTTMNAFIQEVNKEYSKKIVTLEDPIEYEHKSDKSIIIQKEIGKESDVLTFADGLKNLLREDSDIAVLGEIRDKATMDVALDLAESGGLVIGTLHTRSCGETVERIINMYDPADQRSVKGSISSVLKLVVSQKLVVSKKGTLLMVPEIMVVTPVIAAQIRQEKFNISEINDSIHSQNAMGSMSFEQSFADLYARDLIDMKVIRENVDSESIDMIKNLIVSLGGQVEEE